MNRKLPEDAFDFYFSLGPGRSYDAVAKKFGVSKRSVTTLATKADWQGRLASLHQRARERSDAKAIETLEQMSERHIKALQFVFAKGIETLRATPMESAADAVRAILSAIKHERLVRGEATERTEGNSLEEITKREIATLLEIVEVPDDDGEEDDDEADDEGQQVRAV